jgi:RNA-directed DNA polymerase
VRKYGEKLLITPAKSKVQRLREKLKQMMQSALGLSQEELLRKLNPRLTGWANFYRHGASKRTFANLDRYVFLIIWRWITRRHPEKTRAWKKRKYFWAAGENRDFSVRVQRKGGESRVLKLYRLASTSILRHLKVKGVANPFDPLYTDYFEKRRCFAWRIRIGSWTASQAKASYL